MEKEFKSDQVQVKVSEQSGCQIHFDITLSGEECKKAKEEALKRVQKQANLPGFRKGKAPANLVDKQFPAAVEGEWRDVVINRAFRLSVELSNVYPWDMEQVSPGKIDSLSADGATLSFQFEREPSVPLVKREELDLPPVEPAAVTDQDVEERIFGYKEHHGTFETLEREITDQDYVSIDVFSLETEPAQQLVENARIVMKKGTLPDWLYELLLGKKADESVEGVSRPDETSSDQQREQYKPTRTRVDILAVEQLIPLSDEEFCEAMKVESIEKLRERVRSQIEREAQGEAEQQRRERLWQHLLQSHPFDLPSSILKSEKHRIVRLMVARMRESASQETVLQHEREIDHTAEREADANLRRFFLARAVVTAGKAEPTEHEIVTRAVQLMIQDRITASSNQAERRQVWELYRNEAFYQLLITKAENLLLAIERAA